MYFWPQKWHRTVVSNVCRMKVRRYSPPSWMNNDLEPRQDDRTILHCYCNLKVAVFCSTNAALVQGLQEVAADVSSHRQLRFGSGCSGCSGRTVMLWCDVPRSRRQGLGLGCRGTTEIQVRVDESPMLNSGKSRYSVMQKSQTPVRYWAKERKKQDTRPSS